MIDRGEVQLAPMTASQVPAWLAWRREAKAQQLMAIPEETLEMLEARLANAGAELSDRSRKEFRWVVLFNGDPVGTVMARDVDWAAGVAEVGFMLSRASQRQGIAKRALALFLVKAFREGGLTRLWAKTSEDNLAARRLLERVGFWLEGTLRKHVLVEGKWVTQVLYGLLRSEWHAPA